MKKDKKEFQDYSSVPLWRIKKNSEISIYFNKGVTPSEFLAYL